MPVKWTEEAIRAEAAKYSSKAEFVKKCSGGAQAAWKRGLLDELFENQLRSWTEENVRAEAAKYKFRIDFKTGCQAAYQAARRLGIVQELFGTEHKKGTISKWTESAIRAEAAKYSSRNEFDHTGASQAARSRFPGLLDEIFGEFSPKWTEKTIRTEASKYKTKRELQLASGGCYVAAGRRFPGLLDDIFGENFRWSREALITEALKYESKTEFQREHNGAYCSMWKYHPGLLDELFENQPQCTDGDAFYIWRVDGQWFNGLPVFKIGITSVRRGFVRIYQCASANRVRVSEVHLFQAEHAKLIERKFHEALEVVPDLDFTDGKTEFRSCDEGTLRGLISFATMLGDRLGEEEELLAA